VSARSRVRAVSCCLILAGIPSAAMAEGPKSATPSAANPVSTPPPVATDRPDITDSSAVIGRGVWQLESGVSFERDGAGRAASRTLSAPTTLVRFGLSERLEPRIGADGYVSTRPVAAGGPRAHGASDVNVGIKYVLAAQSQIGLDVAVIPALSLPTGSAAVSSGGYDSTVKLAWARDLPRGFGLSGNVNVVSATDGERFTSREVTCSLGHDLAGGWAGFWEVYRASALERGGAAAWLADTGVMHPWGANAQFDVSVGRGLNEAAPHWFAGVGLSMRGFFRHR
jgi:hypothetical protein